VGQVSRVVRLVAWAIVIELAALLVGPALGSFAIGILLALIAGGVWLFWVGLDR
jgi:hypothetical protein